MRIIFNPRLVLSCLVLSCLVLSCLVLSCLVLSCLVLSCLVLSCLVLSCLVLSCLVGVLANTPGGVKRTRMGAHACWVIMKFMYQRLCCGSGMLTIWYGIPISYCSREIKKNSAVLTGVDISPIKAFNIYYMSNAFIGVVRICIS